MSPVRRLLSLVIFALIVVIGDVQATVQVQKYVPIFVVGISFFDFFHYFGYCCGLEPLPQWRL